MITFDPKEHKGKKLFELQTNEIDGVVEVNIVPSIASFEEALNAPYFYVVNDEIEENE